MSEDHESPATTLVCPKCDEQLVHSWLRHEKHEIIGPRELSSGVGTEALDVFPLEHHADDTGSPGCESLDELRRNYDFVVLGCKACGHIIGITPCTRPADESNSELVELYRHDIDVVLQSLKALAHGLLNGLRNWQFPDDDEAQDQAYEHDNEAAENLKLEDITQEAIGAFAAAAEATLERQLTKAADRLTANLSKSIAHSVASALDERLAALEERLAQNGNQNRNGPIPVRIQEIDPEATIRVEDDGREKEVRVTNTPLDVRQLPG